MIQDRLDAAAAIAAAKAAAAELTEFFSPPLFTAALDPPPTQDHMVSSDGVTDNVRRSTVVGQTDDTSSVTGVAGDIQIAPAAPSIPEVKLTYLEKRAAVSAAVAAEKINREVEREMVVISKAMKALEHSEDNPCAAAEVQTPAPANSKRELLGDREAPSAKLSKRTSSSPSEPAGVGFNDLYSTSTSQQSMISNQEDRLTDQLEQTGDCTARKRSLYSTTGEASSSHQPTLSRTVRPRNNSPARASSTSTNPTTVQPSRGSAHTSSAAKAKPGACPTPMDKKLSKDIHSLLR
jgi:chorismate mutase